MKILDMCCGSKMFWYNKNEPHTTYIDIRHEIDVIKDRGHLRKVGINPDIQADWKKLPFERNTFDLIIFDPPHLINAGKSSWLKIKYGTLNKDHPLQDIRVGFEQAMKVLKPNGIILFKWNQEQIPFRKVLDELAKDKIYPILGDRRSKTKWTVFLKTEVATKKHDQK